MIVNTIEYIAENKAAVRTDGVSIGVSLLKDGIVVYDNARMFSGHSCEIGQKHSIRSTIADTLVVTATDVEVDSQYIAVNGKKFNIPTAADNKIIVHSFFIGQLYLKFYIPWLDMLPGIPYEPWMWIPPGFEVVKMP